MRRLVLVLSSLTLILLLSMVAVSADPTAPGGARDRLQQQGRGWIAGHTSVSDLTWEQKLSLLGRLPGAPVVDAPRFVPRRDPRALPRKLDWRDNNGDFITSVRDQEDCGSCYAFSAVGAVEGNWAIRLAMNNPTLDLSEQFAVSCQSRMGCEGGWMAEALAAIREEGIPDEACFRYDAYDTACSKACDDWALRTLGIDHYEVVLNKPAETDADFELIMQALQEGPLTVGFDVYDDFFDYTWGIYSPMGMYAGSHGVVIVGYDADSRYWICKNSWGSGWGESGYFRIRWGTSNMGSETFLPVPPPCTDDELYIRPMMPRQNFIRYTGAAMPITVRVTSDCLRGVNNVALTATVNDQSVTLYDDGQHNDEAANDGILGGTVPAASLAFGKVTVNFTATRDGYPDADYSLTGQIKLPADVLVISDDGDSNQEEYYGKLLTDLGIDYDLWDVTQQGKFPANLLPQKPPAVLWFTGPSLGTFEEPEMNAMEAYLDGGGKLLVIGQDLLQNLMANRPKFARDYLHIDKQWNDTQYTVVAGVADETLTNGLGAKLVFPFTNYTDVIRPTEDAKTIWLDGRNRTAGLRYPIDYDQQGTYRLALAAFPVEALPADQAGEFVNRTIEWFFHDACFDTDGDGYSVGGACIGEPDCANDDPNVYPGATEICDDGVDNDCNGLTDADDPVCAGVTDDDTVDDDVVDDDVTDDDVDDDDTGDDSGDDDDDSGCGC